MDMENDDTPFTYEEMQAARNLLWSMGLQGGWEPGSFTSALIEALMRADQNNRQKLLTAFPEFQRPLNVMTSLGGRALAQMVEEQS